MGKCGKITQRARRYGCYLRSGAGKLKTGIERIGSLSGEQGSKHKLGFGLFFLAIIGVAFTTGAVYFTYFENPAPPSTAQAVIWQVKYFDSGGAAHLCDIGSLDGRAVRGALFMDAVRMNYVSNAPGVVDITNEGALKQLAVYFYPLLANGSYSQVYAYRNMAFSNGWQSMWMRWETDGTLTVFDYLFSVSSYADGEYKVLVVLSVWDPYYCGPDPNNSLTWLETVLAGYSNVIVKNSLGSYLVTWFDENGNVIPNIESATVSGTITAKVDVAETQVVYYVGTAAERVFTLESLVLSVYSKTGETYSATPVYKSSKSSVSNNTYTILLDTAGFPNGEYRLDLDANWFEEEQLAFTETLLSFFPGVLGSALILPLIFIGLVAVAAVVVIIIRRK